MTYNRTTQLKKLIFATDAELSDRDTIIHLIIRALRGTYKNVSHWTYDVNRHIALLQAFRFELAALKASM